MSFKQVNSPAPARNDSTSCIAFVPTKAHVRNLKPGSYVLDRGGSIALATRIVKRGLTWQGKPYVLFATGPVDSEYGVGITIDGGESKEDIFGYVADELVRHRKLRNLLGDHVATDLEVYLTASGGVPGSAPRRRVVEVSWDLALKVASVGAEKAMASIERYGNQFLDPPNNGRQNGGPVVPMIGPGNCCDDHVE